MVSALIPRPPRLNCRLNDEIASGFRLVLFGLGIIGTGLSSLPVLAGSAAYAFGETLANCFGRLLGSGATVIMPAGAALVLVFH